jgi:penicillin-binding protein 1A
VTDKKSKTGKAPNRRAIKIALFLMMCGAVAGIAAGVYLTRDMPQVDSLQFTVPRLTTKVYGRDGRLIQEYGAEKRVLVPYTQISPKFFDALIAVEDSSFYQHHGVSVRGVLRAVFKDLIERRKGQGGSTITQQLARQYFLTLEKLWVRKIREMILAINIEKRYSKQQILEMYANKVYFGHGYYGIESASRFYFGKPASALATDEAALLAGMIQLPMQYSPINHPDRARARRNLVLDRMALTGKISSAEASAQEAKPLGIRAKSAMEEGAAAYVSERVRMYCEEKYGEEALYEKGLQVFTTIDPKLQETAVIAVREGLHEYTRRHGYKGPLRGGAAPDETTSASEFFEGARVWATVRQVSADAVEASACGRTFTLGPAQWKWAGAIHPSIVFKEGDRIMIKVVRAGTAPEVELEQPVTAQGALLALNPHTGEVLALVGGYDFASSMYNRVIQAKRQTGSAVKPIIYARAFADGVTLADNVVDEPTAFLTGREKAAQLCSEAYIPRDFDPDYFGRITYQTALEHSVNICAVHLLNQIGMNRVIDFAKRLHITSDLKPYPSMALGAFEITLWDLTAAYAAIDNQGVYVAPYFIAKITDREGRTLEETHPAPEPVLDPAAAFVTVQGMTGVIKRGTGGSAADMKGHFAGKTGTTDDYTDSWFIGFNPNMACGVWTGRDDHKPLGRLETGARVGLPIWRRFMEPACAGQEDIDWPMPETVVKVMIDPQTGLRAGVDTPCTEVREQYFVKGTEPTKACNAQAHFMLKLPYFLQRYPLSADGRLIIPEADVEARCAQFPTTIKRERPTSLLVTWSGTTFSVPLEIAGAREGPVPQAVMPGLPHEGSVACGAVVEYIGEQR